MTAIGLHARQRDVRARPELAQFELPRFAIPAPLARIAASLPQLPPTLALVVALNASLDRILPRESLAPLIGKIVCIRVTDAGLCLRVAMSDRGFGPAPRGVAPDLTISASARDFVALALRREDPDALFFDRRLLMEGDTELGLIVKNTLDAVDAPGIERVLEALGSAARVLGLHSRRSMRRD